MEDVRNGERLKMRHWLKKVIDSGEYHGVEWTDRDAGKFRVPWKHASRHGWDIDRDASIFKMWAVYTGKYSKETSNLSEKQKRALAKHWKANFRCALNALNDIEVVHKEGKTKGRDAYKVFRLLPQCRTKSKITKIRSNSTGSVDEKEPMITRGLHRTKSAPVYQPTLMESDEQEFSSQMLHLNSDHTYSQVKSEEQSIDISQAEDATQFYPLTNSLNNYQFGDLELSPSSNCSSDSCSSDVSKLVELLSPSVCSQDSSQDISEKIGAVLTELVNSSAAFSYEQDSLSTGVSSKSQYLRQDIFFSPPSYDFQDYSLSLPY